MRLVIIPAPADQGTMFPKGKGRLSSDIHLEPQLFSGVEYLGKEGKPEIRLTRYSHLGHWYPGLCAYQESQTVARSAIDVRMDVVLTDSRYPATT